MASIVLAYGVALGTLSFIIQQITPPAVAQVILITGISGGGFCVLWGIVALAGHKRRAWAVITMTTVAFVMLSQVVQAWLSSTDATSTSLTGRLVLTLMLLMTVGVLTYLLHGERTPEFYQTGNTRGEHSASHGTTVQTPGARP
jgi:hypothetical protein